MADVVKLSIVIPAYNEAQRLPATLASIAATLGPSSTWRPYEVVVVDDASGDATAAAAAAVVLPGGRMRVLKNRRNRGKGGSIRRGMAAARGRRLLFTDADLSTPLTALERLNAEIEAGADVAIGSRAVPGAELQARQPWYRELMGKTFNRLVRILALPGIRDSQCGFKLFTRDAGRRLFRNLTIHGFGFDVEVLFLAHRAGMAVAEVPVPWRNSLPSKVSPVRDSVRMLVDLIRIRMRHRRDDRRR